MPHPSPQPRRAGRGTRVERFRESGLYPARLADAKASRRSRLPLAGAGPAPPSFARSLTGRALPRAHVPARRLARTPWTRDERRDDLLDVQGFPPTLGDEEESGRRVAPSIAPREVGDPTDRAARGSDVRGRPELLERLERAEGWSRVASRAVREARQSGRSRTVRTRRTTARVPASASWSPSSASRVGPRSAILDTTPRRASSIRASRPRRATTGARSGTRPSADRRGARGERSRAISAAPPPTSEVTSGSARGARYRRSAAATVAYGSPRRDGYAVPRRTTTGADAAESRRVVSSRSRVAPAPPVPARMSVAGSAGGRLERVGHGGELSLPPDEAVAHQPERHDPHRTPSVPGGASVAGDRHAHTCAMPSLVDRLGPVRTYREIRRDFDPLVLVLAAGDLVEPGSRWSSVPHDRLSSGSATEAGLSSVRTRSARSSAPPKAGGQVGRRPVMIVDRAHRHRRRAHGARTDRHDHGAHDDPGARGPAVPAARAANADAARRRMISSTWHGGRLDRGPAVAPGSTLGYSLLFTSPGSSSRVRGHRVRVASQTLPAKRRSPREVHGGATDEAGSTEPSSAGGRRDADGPGGRPGRKAADADDPSFAHAVAREVLPIAAWSGVIFLWVTVLPIPPPATSGRDGSGGAPLQPQRGPDRVWLDLVRREGRSKAGSWRRR
jgi:hypothetical protein